MREQFKEVRFRKKTLELIDQVNAIIADYQDQDLRLTLRQAYYQLVSANLVPNTEKSYKKVGTAVSNGRLAGLIDWDAIEDRVRQPKVQAEWDSLEELVEDALQSFRLPRLSGQRTYAELWVEKDALAGVLSPIANEYHVTLMVNRGYSSQSAMYEAAQRIEACMDDYECEEAVVFYLGDLDPSGEDMVRDIGARLSLFGCMAEVEKIALTIDQVREYNLPPNPAKLTDTRAAAFIAKYGTESWEVDALPPAVLQQVIRESLDDALDLVRMQRVIDDERRAKARLREKVRDL